MGFENSTLVVISMQILALFAIFGLLFSPKKSTSTTKDEEKQSLLCQNFQKSDWSSSLTHHDLETNILESSNGYKIIDWEYASNGHYSFDRHSLGLMNDNKMLNELIKFMNYFWSLIRKKD